METVRIKKFVVMVGVMLVALISQQHKAQAGEEPQCNLPPCASELCVPASYLSEDCLKQVKDWQSEGIVSTCRVPPNSSGYCFSSGEKG